MTPISKTILAVDDEPKILEVVAAYLGSKGFVVLTAENGRDALVIFEQDSMVFASPGEWLQGSIIRGSLKIGCDNQCHSGFSSSISEISVSARESMQWTMQ
jgi:CheY-like chemotaxis protein